MMIKISFFPARARVPGIFTIFLMNFHTFLIQIMSTNSRANFDVHRKVVDFSHRNIQRCPYKKTQKVCSNIQFRLAFFLFRFFSHHNVS